MNVRNLLSSNNQKVLGFMLMVGWIVFVAGVLMLASNCPPSSAQAAPIVEDEELYWLDQEQLLNHTLYYHQPDPIPLDAPYIVMTTTEEAWAAAQHGYYWQVQAYLNAMTPDPNGAYCLNSAPLGDTGIDIVWPVQSCGSGVDKYSISSGVMAWISGGFAAEDAVQTFYRENGIF